MLFQTLESAGYGLSVGLSVGFGSHSATYGWAAGFGLFVILLKLSEIHERMGH